VNNHRVVLTELLLALRVDRITAKSELSWQVYCGNNSS